MPKPAPGGTVLDSNFIRNFLAQLCVESVRFGIHMWDPAQGTGRDLRSQRTP